MLLQLSCCAVYRLEGARASWFPGNLGCGGTPWNDFTDLRDDVEMQRRGCFQEMQIYPVHSRIDPPVGKAHHSWKPRIPELTGTNLRVTCKIGFVLFHVQIMNADHLSHFWRTRWLVCHPAYSVYWGHFGTVQYQVTITIQKSLPKSASPKKHLYPLQQSASCLLC